MEAHVAGTPTSSLTIATALAVAGNGLVPGHALEPEENRGDLRDTM